MIFRHNCNYSIDVLKRAVIVQDLGTIQADVSTLCGVDISHGRCARLQIVDQTLGEEWIVAQVDQVRHPLRRRQADEALFNANTQFFKRSLSFFVHLLGLL